MFPTEFADLLNRRGRKLLDGDGQGHEVFRRRGATPIVLFEDLIDDDTARRCIADLDGGMYAHLKRMYTPIPREAITKMKENYTDSLRKTVRVRTATFNSRTSRVLDAANAIGLGPMLESQSFLRFAEVVVGQPMRSDWWGRQVICYEPGDYSGPHNDHHPEHTEIKNGFVDVHIMFSNDAVASQLLVYEERGFLSRSHEVAAPSGIAVYRLPFWHYTTPLVARKGREGKARRWLLLGSFHFRKPPKKLLYRS
ncbi:MAG TPA: hypothetical protein VJZ76_13455 [Thermoanaerobaculia bacterium]|nr:hypothetical protein [Thermoanaerobaculia bacterium]